MCSSDLDADREYLTFSLAVLPTNGVATVNADGTFTYTPASGYSGGDVFFYRVTDSSMLASIPAPVGISVLASNTAPVAGFGSSIALNTRGWVDAPRTPFVRGATNFTIELWVKNPTLNDGSFHAIIGAETPNSTNSANPLPLRSPSLFLAPINGGLHFDLSSASSNRLGNFVWGFFNSPNAWVHVAWVKDGRTFRFYRNGSIVTNRLAPCDFYINPAGFSIGRVGPTLWHGSIDGVKIWNIARTDAQIARDMCACVQGTEPGLAAAWSFDEAVGTVAYDASPNRNHGIL